MLYAENRSTCESDLKWKSKITIQTNDFFLQKKEVLLKMRSETEKSDFSITKTGLLAFKIKIYIP